MLPSEEETLTQCCLMLVHRLRRWPNIGPVLGYRWVFEHTLPSLSLTLDIGNMPQY